MIREQKPFQQLSLADYEAYVRTQAALNDDGQFLGWNIQLCDLLLHLFDSLSAYIGFIIGERWLLERLLLPYHVPDSARYFACYGDNGGRFAFFVQ